MNRLKNVIYGFVLTLIAISCEGQEGDFNFDYNTLKIPTAELENYMATIRVNGKYGIVNANGKT